MRENKQKQSNILRKLYLRPEFGVTCATVSIFLFFSVFAEHFFSFAVMSNILLLSAELGMVAIGVAFLMIAGEFDLSVGSVLGLSAAIALPLMNYGYDPIMCVLISVFLCTCVGLLNGILVTQLRIHSLIITLAGLMFYRAFVLGITGGYPLRLEERHEVLKIFSFWYNGVPGTFFWFMLFLIIFTIVLGYTKFGNWVFATGGEQNASRNMGVPVTRVKILCFMAASFMASMAGIVQMARYTSVDSLRGYGIELEAVFAVVVGGAALTGGYGSIVGAALGVIMVSMIKQGLILMGIEAYWFRAGIGVVLVVAAVINTKVMEQASK